MARPDNFMPSSLVNCTKDQLFSFFKDSTGLDQDELNHVVIELAKKLQSEVTRFDLLRCVLLACSENQQLSWLGTDMLSEFANSLDHIQYWAAIYDLAQTTSGQRNLATTAAYVRLMMYTESKSDEELEMVMEKIRDEHRHFIGFIAMLLGKVNADSDTLLD